MSIRNSELPKVFYAICTSFFVLVISVTCISCENQNTKNNRQEPRTDSITNEPSFASPDVSNDINESWNNIELGNRYLKVKDYENAAKAFEKAYATRYGSKALSGLKLLETYEKLGQYAAGVKLADNMTASGHLSEHGIKETSEIKTRLLAAEQAKDQPSHNPKVVGSEPTLATNST